MNKTSKLIKQSIRTFMRICFRFSNASWLHTWIWFVFVLGDFKQMFASNLVWYSYWGRSFLRNVEVLPSIPLLLISESGTSVFRFCFDQLSGMVCISVIKIPQNLNQPPSDKIWPHGNNSLCSGRELIKFPKAYGIQHILFSWGIFQKELILLRP